METVKFVEMKDGTKDDYDWMLLFKNSEPNYHTRLADRVLDMLKLMQGPTRGYQVDRYTHSLQSATLAYRDGADEEMVVCALLHDIGDIMGPAHHADMSAAILKPYISADNHWVVKQHSIFQGYFFWQHRGRDQHMREKFRGHPGFEPCAYFCEKYDQPAVSRMLDTMHITDFEPMVRRLFARKPFDPTHNPSFE